MTNTYDTSNFLPCPFCGADPEAQDWHGGPRARIFIQCPNGNYDDEHGGCSVGPQVVGSDMEDAAARWNRRATGPDASGLVQVLESIVEHYPHPDIDHKQFRVLTCRFARQALSEYRESTRVQHAANRDQLHQMAFEYGGDEAGQGYMVTVEEFDAILDRAMQPATAQVPEFRSSKDGEHWPRTGDKYLVKLNGVLQEEIFEFDQGDDGMGGGDYFWSRDDIDECPPFMPDSDEWLPLSALLAASPAPGHSGDGNEMVGWISVKEQTPSQGERVLLKIDLEDCPVVGYWGCGRYEACTVNVEVSCGTFCYGGDVEGSFDSDEVTHWMPIEPPRQEDAER